MTIWRIRRKIIRTAITVTYARLLWTVLTILDLRRFCVLCSVSGFSVKVILSVSLLCNAWKGRPQNDLPYTVSGGNFTHSLSIPMLSLMFCSIVYVDDSAEVAEARAVFERRDIRHSIKVKHWQMSKHFEIYPGRYVSTLVQCQ